MSMIGIGNQEFFAMYATFGFTGHVQVLVRTNVKIYKNDEPWYCRPCKINLFPYFELTNNQLIKLHENNKTKNINKDCNTFCNSQKISVVCSVCDKRNNRADTSASCRNCNSVVHKKCSWLKQAKLLELKRDRGSFLWECSTCMKDEFPFHSVGNMDIVSGSFNSNFSCKF